MSAETEPFTPTPEQAEHIRLLQTEVAAFVEGLDPSQGHAWRITAEHVGVHGLARTADDGTVQVVDHRFAEFIAQPWTLTVQAWSLREAFTAAAERPLDRFDVPWLGPDEDADGWRAARHRYRVLTEQHIARLQRLLVALDGLDRRAE